MIRKQKPSFNRRRFLKNIQIGDKRIVGKWISHKDWDADRGEKIFCMLVAKGFFHGIDREYIYHRVCFDGNNGNGFYICAKPKMVKFKRPLLTLTDKKIHEFSESMRVDYEA